MRVTARARRRALAVVVATLIAAGPATAWGQSPISESDAKAGFLLNCAMFVEWPGTAAAGDLAIGILGDDRLVEVIGSMKGPKVRGRVIRVKAVQPQDDVRAFQILFIGNDRDRDAAAVLARVAEAPVLTVGEAHDFIGRGGIVRLYTEQNRLRFEVKPANAERASLRVSARMLGLARIVQ